MRIATIITAGTLTMLLSCGMGHDMAGMNTNSTDPAGTWTGEVTTQDPMGGHSMTTTTKTTIAIDQKRFRIAAETITSGMGADVTMPLYERVGTWSMHGDTVRFEPDTCRVYDAGSDAMVISGDCGIGTMWGMLEGENMMTMQGIGMMEGDTSTLTCTRK